LVFTRSDNSFISINTETWEENTLPNNFKFPDNNFEINPINMALNHSVEMDGWKAEFIGKFKIQKRTFDKGQGLIPTGSVTKSFEVFSGDVIFSANGQSIFKQHFENYAGYLEFIMYPQSGLIILGYTNLSIYPIYNVYIIKIKPFPLPTSPPDIGGFYRRK
jgi:hypothetical protein